MKEYRPSATALGAAMRRAAHQIMDDHSGVKRLNGRGNIICGRETERKTRETGLLLCNSLKLQNKNSKILHHVKVSLQERKSEIKYR